MRRAKSDGIDAEVLLRTLLAWQRGEPRVCSTEYDFRYSPTRKIADHTFESGRSADERPKTGLVRAVILKNSGVGVLSLIFRAPINASFTWVI